MKGKRRGVAARALAVGLLAGAIAGCSVPDWADPGEWLDDSAPPPPRRSSGRQVAPPPPSGAAQQPQQQRQSQQQAEAPSDEKDFPELASTPERPRPRTTAAQRRQIQQGLVADRENARYGEQVPVGGEVQAPPPPPPPSSSLAPAPRPQAARSVPEASPAAAPPAASPPPAPPPPPPPPAAVSSAPRAFGASDPAAPQVFSPQRPVAAEPPRPAPETVPPAPSALTAPPPPPPPPVAASAAPAPPPPPAFPRVEGASPPPAAPPPPPALPRVDSASPPPAAPPRAQQPSAPPAPVPQLNLPVAEDQQVLAQAFAQSVAAQAAPVSPTPGASFGSAAFSAPPPQSAALAPSGLVSAPSGAPIATITFAHGGAALGSGDLAAVRRVAEAARGGGVVRVIGHASQRTANMSMEEHRLANFNVSFERAQAVARALRRAGVDPSRLIVEAVGDSQPLYYEFMPNGEAENRRVEIFLE